MRSNDNAQCCATIPLQFDLIESPMWSRLRGGQHHFQQVGFQTHQDGLRLGVAHAAVEFQRFRVSACVNHQPCVKETGIGNAVLFHAADGWQNDLAHGARMHVWRYHRGRRIGAHAASVGAQVTIKQAFMVLAGRQRQHIFTVTHDDKAGFLAAQKFFNDNSRPALVMRHAQGVVYQHEINGFMCLGQGHCYHDAFAGGQTVSLHDNRHTFFVQIGMGRSGVRKGFVLCSRDAMTLHEGLGIRFGAFQLSSRLGGAKNTKSVFSKLVDHARSQWSLRAHHGEGNLLLDCPGAQFTNVGDIDINQLIVPGRAAITGCHIHGV